MLPENHTSSAPQKAVTPRHALLENLISLVNKHISDQFNELSTQWAGSLVDAGEAVDVKTLQARLRAGNRLRTDHYAFLGIFARQLENDLRLEIAQLAPGQKAPVRKVAESLSLVSMEEMDTKVTLGSFSKPFEAKYSDGLATLNVRLAFLLDRDILRINQNPFRPEVFLGAFQQAWIDFIKDEEANELMKPFLRPEEFFDFGAMLQELSSALERKGVGPGSVEKHKSRRADSHDASQASSRKKNQQAALAEQLRQFFSGAGDAPGGKAAPTGFDQLGDLDLSLPSERDAGAVWYACAYSGGAGSCRAGKCRDSSANGSAGAANACARLCGRRGAWHGNAWWRWHGAGRCNWCRANDGRRPWRAGRGRHDDSCRRCCTRWWPAGHAAGERPSSCRCGSGRPGRNAGRRRRAGRAGWRGSACGRLGSGAGPGLPRRGQ